MMDDGRLRDAYAELIAARAPVDRGACAAPEALLALVEREGDEAVRLATLDHVMGCARCREELDLLRAAAAASAQAAGASSSDPSGRRRRSEPRWPTRPLAIAAGIILVIGVGVITRRGDDGASRLRGGDSSLALLAPERASDGGMLLRWRSIGGAPRYRVEVYTPSGTTVAEGIVTDTTFVVGPASLGGRPDTLTWMVTALRADGGEVRSAPGRIAP